MGAVGMASGISNGIPEIFVKIFNLINSGEYNKARDLHYKLLPLFNFCNQSKDYNYNSVIKSIMKIRGLGNVTDNRRPIMPLDIKDETKIKELIHNLD